MSGVLDDLSHFERRAIEQIGLTFAQARDLRSELLRAIEAAKRDGFSVIVEQVGKSHSNREIWRFQVRGDWFYTVWAPQKGGGLTTVMTPGKVGRWKNKGPKKLQPKPMLEESS